MKKITILLFLFLHSVLMSAQETGTLKIEVEGLRNQQGVVNITLFDKSDGFPEDIENAFRISSTEVSGRKAVFEFKNLKPGDYAFAILHDEDKDGKMDKNFIGMPKEGFAFSNNYRPRAGAPSFDDARIIIGEGTHSVKAEIIYYF